MSDAIQIKNLSFGYKGNANTLINNLNLSIREGDRFGIFGPNGAGKTTLMHLMTGLLPYDQGSVQLLGHEMKKHRKKLNRCFGVVPQDFSFYGELSPVENLAFFGAWAGLSSQQIRSKTDELLQIMSLTTVRDKPVHKFSGGMKRRVNLAIGVIHDPQILFLDEPTVGVDIQTRYAIIAYLKKLNEKGTTLVYTSHHLKEAEDLCHSIAMIDEGNILVNDTLETLLKIHRQEGLEGLFLDLTGREYRD